MRRWIPNQPTRPVDPPRRPIRPADPFGGEGSCPEGQVELSWDGVPHIRDAPWMIGMQAVLTSGVRRSARAVTPCITLATPASVILDLLSMDLRFLVQILQLYTTRLLNTEPQKPVVTPCNWSPATGAPGDPLHTMRTLFHTTLGRCDFDGAANLAPAMHLQTFEPGQMLWNAEQTAFYGIILSGEVEIVDGEEATSQSAPFEFGLLCVREPFTTNATATMPTQMLRCAPVDLYKAMENGPDACIPHLGSINGCSG